MGIVLYLQVAVFASHLTLFIMAKIDVNRQDFNFVIDEDVVYNHILEGHVFQRLTVLSPVRCHVKCKDDCLCVSMNYFPQSKENNCELNDADKYMEPAAMKRREGGNYYDLVRSCKVKGGDRYSPEKHRCVNRCCRPSYCLNGGLCQEICDPKITRFNCTCSGTYTGQRCEKLPRSCKDIAISGASRSGSYDIYNSIDEPFSVYCDLQSEHGFVWTLIQSFSLSKRDIFASKPFGTTFPLNQNNIELDLNEYRLSLLQMQSLADHSTHLRATCNFPTDGLQYTDYARAKLEGHSVFGKWSKCQLYEYLNIRGNECSNCSALTRQKLDKSWHIRSYNSKQEGCEFDGKPGGINYEKNFGDYGDRNINQNHSCTSSSTSTTQHWFGTRYDV